MVTTQTRDLHLVVFACEVSPGALMEILRRAGERMLKYNSGAIEQIAVVL